MEYGDASTTGSADDLDVLAMICLYKSGRLKFSLMATQEPYFFTFCGTKLLCRVVIYEKRLINQIDGFHE